MRKCELCKFPARSYCESDEASLCWNCDAKVHGANFLVARHTRFLLCRTCQSLTPWKASGPKLGRTFTICDRCANEANNNIRKEKEISEDDYQLVPWSSITPPSAVSSSSSSFSSSSASQGCVKSLKRTRASFTDLEDDLSRSSSQGSGGGVGGEREAANADHSLKQRRTKKDVPARVVQDLWKL